MVSGKMTWSQLVDILSLLWKVFMKGEVEYDCVSNITAQSILKGDRSLFARQFIMFLANGGRFILLGLKAACAPYNPARVCRGWAFWKGPDDGDGLQGEEARDKASLALQQVDFEQVDFVNCTSTTIIGEDKLKILRKMNRPMLGANACLGLLQDFQLCQNKADSVLEKLYDHTGITYVDFFGDIIRAEDGDRLITFLRRDAASGLWSLHCRTLKGIWRDTHVSAMLKLKSN